MVETIHLRGSGERLSKLDSAVEALPRDLQEFCLGIGGGRLLLKSGGTDSCLASLKPPTSVVDKDSSMRLFSRDIVDVRNKTITKKRTFVDLSNLKTNTILLLREESGERKTEIFSLRLLQLEQGITTVSFQRLHIEMRFNKF